MEKDSVDKNDLKHYILAKIEELVECIQRLGKTELFQITVKYMNGELVVDTDFSDL